MKKICRGAYVLICEDCLNIEEVLKPVSNSHLCIVMASVVKHPCPSQMRSFLAICDPPKQKRIALQQNKKRQISLLMSQALLIWSLKHIYDYEESNICILRTPTGKPYLVNSAQHPPVLPYSRKDKSAPFFSMSYRYPHIGIAFSAEPIGFDLEKWHKTMNEVAPLYCSQEELLRAKKCANSNQLFLRLWTQKEALLKKRGCGISPHISLTTTTATKEEKLLTLDTNWGCFSVATSRLPQGDLYYV